MTKPTQNFECDPIRECLVADVAKSPENSQRGNKLVLPRHLRIRVLDCRSGKPVKKGTPVQEVRVNGKTMAAFLQIEYDWDISKHFPIMGDGAKWEFGLSSVSLMKASQIALNALGYDVGVPKDTYKDSGAKTAFLRFRVVAKAITFTAEDLTQMKLFNQSVLERKFQPAPGKTTLTGIKDVDGKAVEFRAPTPSEADKIILIYNTKCFRAAQFHLASLGFYPSKDPGLQDGVLDAVDGGTWSEAWIKEFKAWMNALDNKYPCDRIKREKEGKALMGQHRGFITDEQGDISIPIPAGAFGSEITVEVGFRDFTVVTEATLNEYLTRSSKPYRRPGNDAGAQNPMKPTDGPTGFAIEWLTGQQETGWDSPWGWCCGMKRSLHPSDRTRFDQFRTSAKFTLPAFTQAEIKDGPTWPVLHRRTRALSLFYQSENVTPELVLFALQWCQPVWDEIDDPVPRNNAPSVNDNTFIWGGTPAELTGRRMHVVTQYYDMQGSDPYGGMGYGLLEFINVPSGIPLRWRGDDGHAGIDLHAIIGAELFAVHGGDLFFNPNSQGFGKMVKVNWHKCEGVQTSISYGHVSDLVGSKDKDRRVKAGEVIAIGGRKGSLCANSDQAGHVHLVLNGLKHPSTSPNLFFTPDPANRCCIPFNHFDDARWVTEGTPLLLPCKCQVTYGSQELEKCGFGDGRVKRKPNSGAATAYTVQISQLCWAVGRLACPKMPRPATEDLETLNAPGVNFVKRRFQAQLRFLINQGKLAPIGFKRRFTHEALELTGEIGDYPTRVIVKEKTARIHSTSSLSGFVIGTVSKGDTLFLRRDDQIEWYMVELPKALRTSTSDDTGWVARSVVEEPLPPSKTRRAIRKFKEDRFMESHSGKPPSEWTQAKAYDIDKEMLDQLNELAPLCEKD